MDRRWRIWGENIGRIWKKENMDIHSGEYRGRMENMDIHENGG
jgi:hypothetical protein